MKRPHFHIFVVKATGTTNNGQLDNKKQAGESHENPGKDDVELVLKWAGVGPVNVDVSHEGTGERHHDDDVGKENEAYPPLECYHVDHEPDEYEGHDQTKCDATRRVLSQKVSHFYQQTHVVHGHDRKPRGVAGDAIVDEDLGEPYVVGSANGSEAHLARHERPEGHGMSEQQQQRAQRYGYGRPLDVTKPTPDEIPGDVPANSKEKEEVKASGHCACVLEQKAVFGFSPRQTHSVEKPQELKEEYDQPNPEHPADLHQAGDVIPGYTPQLHEPIYTNRKVDVFAPYIMHLRTFCDEATSEMIFPLIHDLYWHKKILSPPSIYLFPKLMCV